jgi:hypothetical protein
MRLIRRRNPHQKNSGKIRIRPLAKGLGVAALVGFLTLSTYKGINYYQQRKQIEKERVLREQDEKKYYPTKKSERVLSEFEKIEADYLQRAKKGRKEGFPFLYKVEDELIELRKAQKSPDEIRIGKMFNEFEKLGKEWEAEGDPSLLEKLRVQRARHFIFDPYQKKAGLKYYNSAGELLFRAGKNRGEAIAIFYMYFIQMGYHEPTAWSEAEACVRHDYDPFTK